MDNKQYTLEVQKDSNGELFFEFPDELLNQVGWSEGDIIQWEAMDENQEIWTMTKKIISD